MTAEVHGVVLRHQYGAIGKCRCGWIPPWTSDWKADLKDHIAAGSSVVSGSGERGCTCPGGDDGEPDAGWDENCPIHGADEEDVHQCRSCDRRNDTHSIGCPMHPDYCPDHVPAAGLGG